MNDAIDKLKSGEKKVVLGKVAPEIAKKFNLEHCNRDIVMWHDRLSYIEKHREEYDSDEQYELHIKSIPDIINNPDYVGINPDGTGIEFVKQIDSLSMVAIRISNTGQLVFRSLYPIGEIKLENRKNSGRWIAFSDILDEFADNVTEMSTIKESIEAYTIEESIDEKAQ